MVTSLRRTRCTADSHLHNRLDLRRARHAVVGEDGLCRTPNQQTRRNQVAAAISSSSQPFRPLKLRLVGPGRSAALNSVESLRGCRWVSDKFTHAIRKCQRWWRWRRWWWCYVCSKNDSSPLSNYNTAALKWKLQCKNWNENRWAVKTNPKNGRSHQQIWDILSRAGGLVTDGLFVTQQLKRNRDYNSYVICTPRTVVTDLQVNLWQ